MNVLLKYPVTFIILSQYLPLVVVPALRYGTDESGFMLRTLGFGLLVAIVIETILFPLGATGGKARRIHPASAVVVTLVGGLATVGATLLGARTYGLQLGAIEVSRAAS
ncbi:MAG TPA: hypothetical protein VIG64_05440, partial [Actinomycetota bacterium]